MALATALAGCGGGDGKPASSATQPPAATAPTVAQTTPVTPAPSTPATTPAPKPPPTSTSTTPSATPGGGGGSEPARTELEFTASSSGVSPRQASVAPYIAVRITLRSKDGSAHRLVIDGHTLTVGGARKSSFVELHGLPPGRSYKGRADGRTNVVILSSSEPGP